MKPGERIRTRRGRGRVLTIEVERTRNYGRERVDQVVIVELEQSGAHVALYKPMAVGRRAAA